MILSGRVTRKRSEGESKLGSLFLRPVNQYGQLNNQAVREYLREKDSVKIRVRESGEKLRDRDRQTDRQKIRDRVI